MVIATGGGSVIDEENLKTLKINGWIVWLSGQKDVLRNRMEKEMESGRYRPSLTQEDPLEEIGRVMEARKPFYARAGDLNIDGTHHTEEEVARLIINRMPKKQKIRRRS